MTKEMNVDRNFEHRFEIHWRQWYCVPNLSGKLAVDQSINPKPSPVHRCEDAVTRTPCKIRTIKIK